ncbi:MAG: hypothetical protein ACHREM_10420 [Polyangiales bacterium]
MDRDNRTELPTIRVEIDGVTFSTSSVESALDLAAAASRRKQLHVQTSLLDFGAARARHDDGPPISPLDQLLAEVAHPARHRQLQLLHVTRDRRGRVVRRDELAPLLGFVGRSRNNQIGGIFAGIVRVGQSVGLDATKLVERSSLGYCATPLLIATTLPALSDASRLRSRDTSPTPA